MTNESIAKELAPLIGKSFSATKTLLSRIFSGKRELESDYEEQLLSILKCGREMLIRIYPKIKFQKSFPKIDKRNYAVEITASHLKGMVPGSYILDFLKIIDILNGFGFKFEANVSTEIN